jgi:hypothetical protein
MSGMRATSAHSATQAAPSEKRRKPLQNGGNAASPSLTATGFPPHSVWMASAARTARAGIDQVKGRLSWWVRAHGLPRARL